MIFYIVRHGVTEWNALKKVQGSADIPLAEDGIRLARQTGEALKDILFDICFSSPLTRARQTAELILGNRNIPVILDKRIQEIDFGVLEGTQFRDKNGNVTNEQMDIFFHRPMEFKRPENGENIEDICRRTREFWEEKIQDPSLQNSTILVTSHGCAVRALLRNVYENKDDFWHGHVPPNCGVNIVEVIDGKARLVEEDKVFAR